MKAESLLVADGVYMYEPGKVVIVGTFDKINTDEFPFLFRPFGVAVRLIVDRGDRRRSCNLGFQLRKRGRRKPMLTVSLHLTAVAGTSKIFKGGWVGIMLGPVPFDSAGTYQLSLLDLDKAKTICTESIEVALARAGKKQSSRALKLAATSLAKTRAPTPKAAARRQAAKAKR